MAMPMSQNVEVSTPDFSADPASCKGKLLAGSVIHGSHQIKALTAAEEDAGMALFCVARPEADLTIEVREVLAMGDFPVRKMPSRVARLLLTTARVEHLLQTDAGQHPRDSN